MFSILIIEDRQTISTVYQTFLVKQGYAVKTVAHTYETMRVLEDERIDLVLCNASLKTTDSVMAVEAIRENSETMPIIALSELDDFRTKQRMFNAGVDDFMAKPVDLNELLLRITALLRRSRITSKQRIVIGNAVLDNTTMTVVDGSDSVVLPPKEFKLLFKLCASPGRIFTRADIMDDVWGMHAKSNERTVDVHVKRLRDRFAHNKSFRIETVRGVGYKAIERKA